MEAVGKASNPDETIIILIKDIVLESTINVYEGTNVVIKGNGYTMTNEYENKSYFKAISLRGDHTKLTLNDVVIDGYITYSYGIPNSLIISESTKINGHVICYNITLNGVVNGDLVAIQNVNFGEQAFVSGSIKLEDIASPVGLKEELIENKIHVSINRVNPGLMHSENYYVDIDDVFNKKRPDGYYDINIYSNDILNFHTKEMFFYGKIKDAGKLYGNVKENVEVSDLEVDKEGIIKINDDGTLEAIGVGNVTLSGKGIWKNIVHGETEFGFTMELGVEPIKLKADYSEKIITYKEKENKVLSDYVAFIDELDGNKEVILKDGTDVEYVYGGSTHQTLPTEAGEYEVVVKLLNPIYSFNDEVKVKVVVEHDFGEWEVIKETTKEAEGLKVRKCSICGEEAKEILPKLEQEVDHPNTDKGETATDKPSESVETSDNVHVGLYALIAAVSMLNIAIPVVLKRKRAFENK